MPVGIRSRAPTSLGVIEHVAITRQIGAGSNREHFETRRMHELVDECRGPRNERRVEIDIGGGHPRVIMRPQNAGRLRPHGVLDPGRATKLSSIREIADRLLERNIVPAGVSM